MSEERGVRTLIRSRKSRSALDKQTQTLESLLFISWHTGVGFSLAQRVSDEGGATDPLRGTAEGGDWSMQRAGRWACGAVGIVISF